MVRINVRPRESLDDVELDPEFLMVYGGKRHIWFDGEHLVETDDRRVEVGKYYFDPNGEQLLMRVVEIAEGEREVPVSDVADESGEVTVEILYEAGNDDELPDEGRTEVLPEYLFETEEAVSMGDLSMIPLTPL